MMFMGDWLTIGDEWLKSNLKFKNKINGNTCEISHQVKSIKKDDDMANYYWMC